MATSIITTLSDYYSTMKFSSGRRIDVDPSGKRWVAINDNGVASLYYSTDGAGWTLASGTVSVFNNQPISLFIDVDGGFHLAYIGANLRYLRYRYGTESGGTITWSSEVAVAATYDVHSVDMVAHKLGTDYYAHIIMGNNDYGTFMYHVKIASGVPTYYTGSSVSSSGVRSVSVDFRHTGDGKTVSVQPDLFTANVTLNDILYVKQTYISTPAWTGNTRQNLTNGYKPTYSGGGGAMIAWDGSAVMIAYGQNTHDGVRLLERDLADTTTIDRGLSADPGTDVLPVIVWDADRNIYLVGIESGSSDPVWTKWDRATTTWDSGWTTVEASTGYYYAVAALRTHALNTVEMVWSRNLATDDVAWALVTDLNVAPTAPTWEAPADGSTQDVAESLLLDWAFNDPNASDTQSAWTLRRRIGAGSYEYLTNGGAWQASEDATTKIASTDTWATLVASWGSDTDADHYYTVKTWDAADAGPSPWATELRIIPSAQDNPTVTYPVAFATVGATETVTWTVATQTKYRVVVSDTPSTTNMDAGTLDDDSGLVISSGARSVGVSFPTNGVTRYVKLQTYNDEGLLSDIVQVQVSVLYTPPNTPTLAMTTPTDAITITITNPAGGTAVVSNDLYRRDAGDAGNGIRIAAELAANGVFVDYSVASGKSYEYRVRALGDNDSPAYGAWT